MAAPAGWYPAPAQPGLERYWDGELWSDRYRPAVVPAATATWTPDGAGAAASWAPGGGPAATAPAWVPGVPSPSAPAARPAVREGLGIDPGGTALTGAALVADGVLGVGSERQGIGGALQGIALGLVFLVGSFFLVPTLLAPGRVDAGEVETTGTVTEVTYDSEGLCSATARFEANGATWSAPSHGSQKPCPYAEGEQVRVIYDTADPADAVIPASGLVTALVWVFPLAGGLVVVLSAITLVRRVAQVGAGAAMLLGALRSRR